MAGTIDISAAEIIRRYGMLTATKSAVSPWALLDMAIVIYVGSSLLDLFSSGMGKLAGKVRQGLANAMLLNREPKPA